MSDNGNLPAIIVKLRDEAVIKEMSAAVPSHVDPSQWLRVLQTSIMNDPKLLNAKPASILREAVKLAQVGLTTDPHLGEAYLFADNKGGCQARIDYKGLIKLGRQTGTFTQIYAQDICVNDPVQELLAGDEKGIKHKLALSNRGERLGYYAFVKFSDGTIDYEWMELYEILAIRDRHSAAHKFKPNDNPWANSEGEMCKKTVLHRLLKRLPKSTQLERAVSMENETHFGEAAPMRDVTPGAPMPALGLDALADKLETKPAPEPQESPQEAGDDIVDTDTGEVTEAAPEQPQAQHGIVQEQEGFDLGPIAIQIDLVRKGPKPTFQNDDDAYGALIDRLGELDAVPGVRTLQQKNAPFIESLPPRMVQAWVNAVDDRIVEIQDAAA